MGRKSKSVENFLTSLVGNFDEAVGEHERIYRGEVLIFGDFGYGQIRRTVDDLVILSDSRDGGASMGGALLRALPFNARERRAFFRVLGGSGDYAALSCGGRAAIVYRGLWTTCGVGIINLTEHSAVDSFFACEDELFDLTDDGGFTDDLRLFRRQMHWSDGDAPEPFGIRRMIGAASALTGNRIIIRGAIPVPTDRFDMDVTAAILLCMLSAARCASVQSPPRLSFGVVDGDTAVDLSFVTSDVSGVSGVPLGFCRALAESAGIGFSLDADGGAVDACFVPVRSDPSGLGLKASVGFEVDLSDFEQDSDGAPSRS